ncbi:inner centromere protein [Rhodotorula diobovata]|uniref:Inner centromere protein n=1 Tax=Rhodotorula diobovata TaxID=5288 RepID=A0A5C5G0W0_9BASI|nr:inner centromere protein [Rhodotorula diobovata]
MPGTFGAAMVTKAKEASSVEVSEVEEDQGGEDDEEEDDDDEEDRTTMSMLSTATTTLNLSHQPFKPITKTAQLPKPAPSSKSSLASSVSSTAAFGLNRSAGASAASGIKKPVDTKVKSIQRAAAAAKKEKEEADRKNALKEQKRAAIAQKKLEDERKLKVEGLEKKRKEREEAASKAKAGIARMKQKPAGDDEPAKKRKIEPEPKVRPEQKKIGQPTRPLPASSSASASSLAQSQGRAGAMGPPALNKSAGPSGALNKPVGPSAAFSNPLSKSAGASSMVGQSFMSAKIRLPDSSAAPAALPPRPLAPTVPKPFSSAMRPPQPTQAPKVVEPQEPLQELPDIDSEYSDSDDEAHERKNAALPRWAQSPALAQALLDQQQVNPDEIFGPIPKLSIGDFFRNSASAARLRARTSSAQWDGTDGLTQTDLARYQRAMGYKSGLHLAASGPGQADAAHREGDQQHR